MEEGEYNKRFGYNLSLKKKVLVINQV